MVFAGLQKGDGRREGYGRAAGLIGGELICLHLEEQPWMISQTQRRRVASDCAIVRQQPQRLVDSLKYLLKTQNFRSINQTFCTVQCC